MNSGLYMFHVYDFLNATLTSLTNQNLVTCNHRFVSTTSTSAASRENLQGKDNFSVIYKKLQFWGVGFESLKSRVKVLHDKLVVVVMF